jgi:hypothetical protein
MKTHIIRLPHVSGRNITVVASLGAVVLTSAVLITDRPDTYAQFSDRQTLSFQISVASANTPRVVKPQGALPVPTTLTSMPHADLPPTTKVTSKAPASPAPTTRQQISQATSEPQPTVTSGSG